MVRRGANPTMLLNRSLGMSCGMLQHDPDLTPHIARIESGELAAVISDRAYIGSLESQAERRINVDLPEPDGPTIATNSPGRT